MGQNLGKVGICPMGDYASGKSYERLSSVFYNHEYWVAVKDVPVGAVPSATSEYWQKMASRGEQGPQGQSYVDKELVPIVDNLTTGGSSNVLSAEQGKVLKAELTELESNFSAIKGERLEVRENTYISTYGASVGSTFNPTGAAEYDGCASIYHRKISPGERYLIKGTGSAPYINMLVIVDNNNVVTRMFEQGFFDATITIAENESFMYANFLDYDANTQGIWQISSANLVSIEKTLQNVANQNDSNSEKINKLLKNDVPLIADSYLYTEGIEVGMTFSQSPSPYIGSCCGSVQVKKGDEVHIIGQGNHPYFDKYIIVDENNIIKEFGLVDAGESILQITENGIVYFNLWQYNAETDGAFYIRIESESEVNKGINIVCLGDSITEMTDNGTKMGYVEYMQGIAKGANVIRGGIGGTQWAKRTELVSVPSNSTEAYAALDLPSLVNAWSTGDWSYVDAAHNFLKTTDDNSKVINALKGLDIKDAHVVTIMMGTNDWLNSAPLGETESENDLTTLGAVNFVINKILSANPKIKLYLFTNKVCYYGAIGNTEDDNWCLTKKNYNGLTLRDLNDLIAGESLKNGIPCCDMLLLGWNKSNFSQYFPIPADSVHPQKGEGFKVIAKKMWSFMEANQTW